MVNKTYNAADLDAFIKIAASWQNNTLAEDFGGKDMQNYLNPAINLYKKRERTQNWNHQEKKFLLELCRKDMRIIENKRLDAGLTAVKNKAWKIIHQKFSEAFGTDRTCNRLKEQWRRMKACTRNEMLDYNNRVSRYGQETGDRKKPSSFTFEIWDFMQEAKKQCKSEALDGVDYTKVPLALEEDFEFNENAVNNDENESEGKTQHDLCDVRIKEEDESDENEQYNGRSGSIDRISSPNDDSNIASSSDLINNISFTNNFNPDMSNSLTSSFNINNIAATLETLNALRNNFNNGHQNHQNGNDVAHNLKHRIKRQRRSSSTESLSAYQQQAQQQQAQSLVAAAAVAAGAGGGIGAAAGAASTTTIINKQQILSSTPPSSLSSSTTTTSPPITTTTTTTNASTTSIELKIFMEMQAKEHLLRMQILDTQLQTAKHMADIVEINKKIAIQKLHEIASRRMS